MRHVSNNTFIAYLILRYGLYTYSVDTHKRIFAYNKHTRDSYLGWVYRCTTDQCARKGLVNALEYLIAFYEAQVADSRKNKWTHRYLFDYKEYPISWKNIAWDAIRSNQLHVLKHALKHKRKGILSRITVLVRQYDIKTVCMMKYVCHEIKLWNTAHPDNELYIWNDAWLDCIMSAIVYGNIRLVAWIYRHILKPVDDQPSFRHDATNINKVLADKAIKSVQYKILRFIWNNARKLQRPDGGVYDIPLTATDINTDGLRGQIYPLIYTACGVSDMRIIKFLIRRGGIITHKCILNLPITASKETFDTLLTYYKSGNEVT